MFSNVEHNTVPAYPMTHLTFMDVKKLAHEPSPEARSILASKLAMDFRAGDFTRTEAGIAVDIFRIMLKDIDKRVRKTIGDQLAHCHDVPKDIILKLASDESDIAAPVLQYSQVLTDEDLIAIVRSTQEVLKLCAIARRDSISENLSGTLMDTHSERVLADLFKNSGARLPEKGLLQAWQYIASNRSLVETLVHRGGLPLTVAEKMYFVVSDDLKRKLVSQYKLGEPVAQKTSSDAHEWEMLGLIPGDGKIDPINDEDVEDMVDQLYVGGRLTHSLLIRALCVGSLSVFEAGLAKLARVPRVNARILMMDSGALGFKAIYTEASMPEGFCDAIRTLLRVSLEETDFGRARRQDFRRRVIDKIYMQGYHQTVENMEYLLSIIGGRVAAEAH